MPIDLNSEEWENANSDDSLRVKIEELLWRNQNKAYSVREIEEHLLENNLHLFPADLVGDNAVEGARAARQSIIANLLDNRYWHGEVSFQSISEGSDIEPGLYFTSDGPGISPIAEIDEVKDADPDSDWGKLSKRFRQIEGDADEEISELKERISYLEFRVREDLGAY